MKMLNVHNNSLNSKNKITIFIFIKIDLKFR